MSGDFEASMGRLWGGGVEADGCERDYEERGRFNQTIGHSRERRPEQTSPEPSRCLQHEEGSMTRGASAPGYKT